MIFKREGGLSSPRRLTCAIKVYSQLQRVMCQGNYETVIDCSTGRPSHSQGSSQRLSADNSRFIGISLKAIEDREVIGDDRQ